MTRASPIFWTRARDALSPRQPCASRDAQRAFAVRSLWHHAGRCSVADRRPISAA
jgi:hypothetical protein